MNSVICKDKYKVEQEYLLLAAIICVVLHEPNLEKLIETIDWNKVEFVKLFSGLSSVPAEIIAFMDKLRIKKRLHPSLLGFLPSNSKYILASAQQSYTKSSPKKAFKKIEKDSADELRSVLQIDSPAKLMTVFNSNAVEKVQKLRFSNFRDLKNMLKFFQSARFDSLQSLSFKNSPLSLKFIEDFCLVKSLKGIQDLNLSGANIGAMEIAFLADSFYFHSVRKLNLSYCQITDNGVKYIAESVSFGNSLVDLDLSCQKIKLKSKALQFLCESSLQSKLIRLSVAHNQIDQTGLKTAPYSELFS